MGRGGIEEVTESFNIKLGDDLRREGKRRVTEEEKIGTREKLVLGSRGSWGVMLLPPPFFPLSPCALPLLSLCSLPLFPPFRGL